MHTGGLSSRTGSLNQLACLKTPVNTKDTEYQDAASPLRAALAPRSEARGPEDLGGTKAYGDYPEEALVPILGYNPPVGLLAFQS